MEQEIEQPLDLNVPVDQQIQPEDGEDIGQVIPGEENQNNMELDPDQVGNDANSINMSDHSEDTDVSVNEEMHHFDLNEELQPEHEDENHMVVLGLPVEPPNFLLEEINEDELLPDDNGDYQDQEH